MTYSVEWTAPAVRDMGRLPTKAAGAIMAYVDYRLAENPLRLSKPLQDELSHLRSARNGDYRVLFRLDEEHTVIWIVHVDHRAHVYRPR